MESKSTKADPGSFSVRQHLVSVGMEGNPDKLREAYNDVSEHYDEFVMNTKRVIGNSLAKAIAGETKDKNVSILDVCAGTGLLGVQLKEHGFTNIDALDFSQGMLDLAKSKNIYKNYICDSIQKDQKTQVDDHAYDVVCMTGGMAIGHLTSNALPELTRMTKQGGMIAFDISKHVSQTHPSEFGEDTMESTCQSFVADNRWAHWTRQTALCYAADPTTGYPGENSNIYIATVV